MYLPHIGMPLGRLMAQGVFMKQQTFSFATVLGFLGLILVVQVMSASAAPAPRIVCQTAFGEKAFVIENDKIAFIKEDDSGVQRSISSIQGQSVRTQKKHLGFVKTLYLDGNKHRISVKNTDAFSEVDDYLSITSPKGHEMTYPLTCQSA
jgi:hypothetical protein